MANQSSGVADGGVRAVDPQLVRLLVCPRDKLALQSQPGCLTCPQGHRYAVVEGIPILLLPESPQTHIEGERSLAVAASGDESQLPQFEVGANEVDPFVKRAIGATGGSLYQHLVGNLTDYPVPELRLPPGEGRLFVEIGCSWGRWCIAAARKGYRPVGIDPSLKGIRAARRVAQQLGIEAHYLVADGRYLPFPNASFDQIFSYSVLQHISKEDVLTTLVEIRRTLRNGGSCQIQMPNAFGMRCLYHQIRRGFRKAGDFDVRYWTPRELVSTFSSVLGNAELSVDGYFSLNPQIADIRFMPRKYRAILRTSEWLRRASESFHPLTYVADSLYVTSNQDSLDDQTAS